MNPHGVCTKIKEFFDEFAMDEPKEFYLGLSTNLANRCGVQKAAHEPLMIKGIIDNVAHDVAPLLELVGIIYYKKLIRETNGKHMLKNVSHGFDAVSYYDKSGNIYTFCSRQKYDDKEDIYEIKYRNLNGTSCNGKIKAAKKLCEEDNFKCADCGYVASVKEFLDKHTLSDHSIKNCQCKECGNFVGTLKGVTNHLANGSCLSNVVRADISRKLKGTKVTASIKYVTVPPQFNELLSKYLKLCELNQGDFNRIRRATENSVMKCFDAKKHNPKRNKRITLFCRKGDAVDGLESRPVLWYLCSQWIMFKLEALNNVDTKIYVMTQEYCLPWKLNVEENMVEVEADLIKISA